MWKNAYFFIDKAEIVIPITVPVQGVAGVIPIVESPLNAMKVAMEIL